MKIGKSEAVLEAMGGEQGVAEKNDIAMSTDSQSQHATALNVGASLSASYGAVTLSTNFGYSATSNDTQSKKDSRNHSMEITKKASARTRLNAPIPAATLLRRSLTFRGGA